MNKSKYQPKKPLPTQTCIDRLLGNALENGYEDVVHTASDIIAVELADTTVDCEGVPTYYLVGMIADWQMRQRKASDPFTPPPPATFGKMLKGTPLHDAISRLDEIEAELYHGAGSPNGMNEAIEVLRAALEPQLKAEKA
jgi:hypothetical protein